MRRVAWKGGEVLRGARGRADVPSSAGTDHHRGRQRLLHVSHDEPAAAPPRLPRRVEGRVRQAARQQPADARDRGRPFGRRDDAGHDGWESGLRQDRVPEARLPRRYPLRGDRGGGQARVALAPRVGHRHLRAPGPQSARRRRHGRAPERDDAQAGCLMVRRRRSLHFVPGGNEKMLLKALALPADGLILDLEDAVPPDRKVATRPVVKDWLSTREFGARERWVRMNPIWGPLGAADLEETIAGRPDGYVVPKPRHAGDVRGIAQALDRLEQRHGIPHGSTRLTLIATETPEGLLNIREVASASPREDAVAMGFTGKISIHPNQVPVINDVFTPAKEALEEARELIAAFEEYARRGVYAFTFRGRMVDAPHLARARKLLARAGVE